MLDHALKRMGAGSRRHLLRGLLGTAAAALAGVSPRAIARATSSAGYCADTPEQELLKLINDYRASRGLGKLRLGQNISGAAQHHSTDMANRNYFSHTTQGTGDGPQQRMIAHGYPANTTWWGENIYAGYGTQNGIDLGSAQAAFNWWKNSSGHNANMLNSRYTVIGIDRASNSNSQYRNYWTTDFGGASDSAATLCGGGTPTPTTGRLAIVAHQQSSNSTGARLAYDGDPATAWRTSTSTTPSSAWVRFDLGGSRTISEIRWQFSQTGSADQFSIQVSTNGSSWQTLANRGNASAAGVWQSLSTNATARYVRFLFANPNRDRRLGYLSEVEINGPTTPLAAAADAPETGDADQATTAPITSEDPGAREPAGGNARKRKQDKKKRKQRKKKRQKSRKKRK